MEDARNIRKDSRTAKEIANQYGIHTDNVTRIKRGDGWKE